MKKLKEQLEQYQEYLLRLPADFMPKIIASYSLPPPAFTDEFHSSTEDAAIDMTM